MGIPRVERCCGCCSSRGGATFLASITCFGGTIGFIRALIFHFGGIELSHEEKKVIEFELMECVFSAIVGGLLLLGILRDKAGYMLPWLVLFGLNVALLLIMSVLIVPLGLAMGMGGSGPALFLAAFCLGITGIMVHIWLAVFTVYRDIKAQSGSGAFDPEGGVPMQNVQYIPANPEG